MSRNNGDKSRFNRERKQKLARRKRNREFVKGISAKTKTAAAGATSKAVAL